MDDIEELVELFRRSGGKFENTALGYREEDGFYVYTQDSNQEIVVSCPSHLLVDINDVDVNQDGLFIANSGNYKNNIEFLEKYFAFHFNKKMLDQYLEKKRQIDSLTSRDLSLISRVYPPDLRWSGGGGDLEFAKKLILQSHNIKHFGKRVLMPFVTFLNHSKHGRPFHINKDAVSVSGKFSDEVYALYNRDDVVMIAACYGFVADSGFIYSLPMTKVTPAGTRVVINHNPMESIKTPEGDWWPMVRKDRGIVTISWFPLYVEANSQCPARVAQMVASESGISAEGLLYDVFLANLNALVPVAFQLTESDNEYARLLGYAAQRQLEVVSGTRKNVRV